MGAGLPVTGLMPLKGVLKPSVGALDGALCRGLLNELPHGLGLVLGHVLHHALHQLVFRSQGDEGDAEHRVEARGVDLNAAVQLRDPEGQIGALGPTEPVRLHDAHPLGPALQVLLDVVQELLSVVRDLDEPLLQVLLGDGVVAPPAAAVLHLLVGQHGAAGVAPVDGRLLAEHEALLVHLKEDPLVPAVVLGKARDGLTVPVVAVAHALQLLRHVVDVVECPIVGFRLVLDGGVLRRHAEGVEPHGVEHVPAPLAQKARQHVAHGVVADVPHVKRSAGVGEHFKAEELLL